MVSGSGRRESDVEARKRVCCRVVIRLLCFALGYVYTYIRIFRVEVGWMTVVNFDGEFRFRNDTSDSYIACIRSRLILG